MVEVNFNHEVGTALNETSITMLAQRSECSRQFFGNDYGHV